MNLPKQTACHHINHLFKIASFIDMPDVFSRMYELYK